MPSPRTSPASGRGKGLFFGLIAANVLLVAGAVTLIVVLVTGGPAEASPQGLTPALVAVETTSTSSPVTTEVPTTSAPTTTVAPPTTQVPTTSPSTEPTAPPATTSGIDAELRSKIVLNTWYGHYKYANDGKDTYKTESDYYEFYENGRFIYQYAGGGDTLRGPWEIRNERLTVVYENSAVGEVSWDIEIRMERGNQVLYLYDTRPGYEGGYWTYEDAPV